MRRLPPISYAIIVYLLLAFGWWTILLLRETREAHNAKVDMLALELAIQKQIERPADFRLTENYAQLNERFIRQQRMIIGEAILLVLSIAGGMFLLYRNLRREISAAEQQRNFLLSITHELKSPLAGIRLILETFQRRRELKPELQQKLSTNALAETDRLTALVNDLLLSAKLENTYQLNQETIDLGAIVQDAADRVAMKYKTANLHVDIEEDLPTISGDRPGIISVVVNLLENAAKYSQPDPVIETSLQRGGSQELVWTVADNGVGIPDREKRRVWTKFYRVGNEDTRKTKGTGLGLFIVKEMVRRHHGHIEVEDNQPRGTVFKVYLPV